MRAIQSGELTAFRDNRNRWQISSEALATWAGAQWAPTGHRLPDAHSCPPDAHLPAQPAEDDPARDLAVARAAIAQLEVRLDERAALVRAAEARAQAAEALAQRLADLLAARPAPEPAPAPRPSPSRRWWPWRRS